MNKIKTFFAKFSDDAKLVYKNYPVSAIAIVALVLDFIIMINTEGEASIGQEHGLLFLSSFALSAFCAESWGKTRLRKILLIVAGALISFALSWVMYENSIHFYGLTDASLKAMLPRYIVLYDIVVFVWGVYKAYQNSGKAFADFILKLIMNMAMISIICGILAVALTFVCVIFIYLILGQQDFSQALNIMGFICLSFFGLGFLGSVLSLEREVSKFFSFVVKYILLLPLMAAFIVIYIYILKIVITQIVPSNEIFRILAALFIVGLPIWTMAGAFPKDNWLLKIAAWLPYIFAPFLILQGYAIGTRIAAFGMTPMRYLCLALMLFELIYILLYWCNHEIVSLMLPFLMIMAVVTLGIPGINMYDISRNDQKKQLALYADTPYAELTPQEQARLVGAYYYLKEDQSDTTSLDLLTAEQSAAIESVGPYAFNEESSDLHVMRLYSIINTDVSGYSRITQVHYYPKADELIDYSDLMLTDQDEKQIVANIDLTDLIDRSIREERSGIGIADEQPAQLISINDGAALMPSFIVFSVDPEGTVSGLSIEGFLFEK